MIRVNTSRGFTLVELLVVMSIVALLMSLVGPFALNSLEKAQAKQEMLTLRNLLKRVGERSYFTSSEYRVESKGKFINLFQKVSTKEQYIVNSYRFEYLFFEPQVIPFNTKGMALTDTITGTYRNESFKIDIKSYVNGEVSSVNSVN